MPDNTLPLTRVHAILDRMSSVDAVKKPEKKMSKEETTKNEGEKADDDDAEDEKALRQSSAINDAMQMTARLWSRTAQPWPEETVERNISSIGKRQRNKHKQKQARGRNEKKIKLSRKQYKPRRTWHGKRRT